MDAICLPARLSGILKFPPFNELGDTKRRTDAYFAAEVNGQRVPLQNGNHEDLLCDLVR